MYYIHLQQNIVALCNDPFLILSSFCYFAAASQTSGVGGGVASRQMKEAIFLQEVRQAAAEERANRLRWYGSSCTCTCTCTYMYMYTVYVQMHHV